MKVYILKCRLNPPEDRVITAYITSKDVAEARYLEIRSILSREDNKVGWVSLVEFYENDNFELVEGECLHYNDA